MITDLLVNHLLCRLISHVRSVRLTLVTFVNYTNTNINISFKIIWVHSIEQVAKPVLARLIIIRLKTATEHFRAKPVRLVHGMSKYRQIIATVMLDI